MTDLVFAVIETAYGDDGKAPEPRKTKLGRTHKGDAKRVAREAEHGASGPATTVTVAQALEARYGVFQVFFDQHEDEIMAALISGAEGAVDALYTTGTMLSNPFGDAGQDVARQFKHFLATGEIERLGVPGLPSKAALEGRSSRHKSGFHPDGRRVSLIDTGLYEGSVVVDIE